MNLARQKYTFFNIARPMIENWPFRPANASEKNKSGEPFRFARPNIIYIVLDYFTSCLKRSE